MLEAISNSIATLTLSLIMVLNFNTAVIFCYLIFYVWYIFPIPFRYVTNFIVHILACILYRKKCGVLVGFLQYVCLHIAVCTKNMCKCFLLGNNFKSHIVLYKLNNKIFITSLPGYQTCYTIL